MSFDIFVVTFRVTNFFPKLVHMLLFSLEKNWISIFWIPLFSGIAIEKPLHRPAQRLRGGCADPGTVTHPVSRTPLPPSPFLVRIICTWQTGQCCSPGLVHSDCLSHRKIRPNLNHNMLASRIQMLVLKTSLSALQTSQNTKFKSDGVGLRCVGAFFLKKGLKITNISNLKEKDTDLGFFSIFELVQKSLKKTKQTYQISTKRTDLQFVVVFFPSFLTKSPEPARWWINISQHAKSIKIDCRETK